MLPCAKMRYKFKALTDLNALSHARFPPEHGSKTGGESALCLQGKRCLFAQSHYIAAEQASQHTNMRKYVEIVLAGLGCVCIGQSIGRAGLAGLNGWRKEGGI
jgi:hypothetical protein